MIKMRIEALLEVDARRRIVRIVSSSGPLESRPPEEDPAEYVEACRLLKDGTQLERKFES